MDKIQLRPLSRGRRMPALGISPRTDLRYPPNKAPIYRCGAIDFVRPLLTGNRFQTSMQMETVRG
jgi:hypothetical protein